MKTPLPFGARLWFAWICFFRVLFDGAFARRALDVREAAPLPPAPAATRTPEKEPAKPAASTQPSTDAALQLLALLQREGRLIDFLEQDIAGYEDDDVGATARVVHDGCQRALRAHATIEPVRTEAEGAKIELQEGYDPHAMKLSGNVAGSAPYKGVLRHRGWRAKALTLPVAVAGRDASVLAPAEIELP